ncbi:hypothetical protein [Algoriphagus yeomjeoni]|uniref:Uncharacterized protein n=1 Tax=Algoriphagus yeomjeoni TaxID=291403 RepID=A0A327PU41_9BACT|nr:hypothetical protein [Algoriphagus yeomjeoni]RAI94801.1 hypothetical protein LV83_00048 [Algoriphagus yeomjeoni]
MSDFKSSYLISVFIVAVIFVLYGCSSVKIEDLEIKELITTVLARKISISDTVKVSMKADAEWVQNPLLKPCNLESFSRLRSIIKIEAKSLESILSEEDLKKICVESEEDFIFSKKMVPQSVKLVEQNYLDSLFAAYTLSLKNQTVASQQFENLNSNAYIRLSKPIFLQKGEFAFIYYSNHSSESSSSLLVYEKTGQKWELILSFPLLIS